MAEDFAISSSSTASFQPSVINRKRPPSPSLGEADGGSNRKRIKEHDSTVVIHAAQRPESDESVVAQSRSANLVECLAQELQCGCCSDLVYRPVVVSPCQHFFCGSCCVLWVRNGGTNCPACRGVSTAVTPSRPLQAIVDVLIRSVPSKARTERERMQADEVYKAGTSLRIPTPREASPELNVDQSSDFARPCPHCSAENPFRWRCPQPIPDPDTDPDNAWLLEDGAPPGHAYCGNCENLLAILAPSTTKCDLCQVSFCGIGVQGRCLAAPLLSQHPHGMSDISDLIQSADVYECFDSNTVEVEIMLDYLTTQRLTPRHIYREIVTHIQSQPRGFAVLIELDLFVDIHGVNASVDPNPDAPRSRICRLCANEVLLWGLRDWWVRERQKGFLDETVLSRKDCTEGSACGRQSCLAHAREFNHIIAPRDPESHTVPQQNQEPVLPPEPTMVQALPSESTSTLAPEAPATANAPFVIDTPAIMHTPFVLGAPATGHGPFFPDTPLQPHTARALEIESILDAMFSS